MIDWNIVKQEAITAINEIIDNGPSSTSEILRGVADIDLSTITPENWRSMCQFYLDNYKLACTRLEETPDTALVLKAENFISQ